MANPEWRLDLDRWPMARLAIQDPSLGMRPAEDSLYAAFRTILSKQQRCVLLWDLSDARPDPLRRKHLAERSTARWREIQGAFVAIAGVAPSALQRNVVAAVLWVLKPPFPVKVFDSSSEAEPWLLDQLHGEGLLLSQPAQAIRQ